jgi:asparagine synthetase B (glutamine-hydrolysing)|tara:strand:+ start:1026 stop:2780 length:1755 start_codon:yes stop_codon:yes gene_type:complete
MIKISNIKKTYHFFNKKINIDFSFVNKIFFSNGLNKIFILGDPILNSTINFQSIIDAANSDILNNEFLKKIDGEFLLIIINERNVTIVSDRFSSIPLYYSLKNNEFNISTNMLNLFKKLDKKNLKIEKFMEFLYFQRLHGYSTYSNEIHILPASTKLKYNFKNINLDKYWFQNFKKDNNYNVKEYAIKLGNSIQNSIKKKTSDKQKHNNKFGLFLSGGMDTRTVLAGFTDIKPISFTLGFSDDAEYKIAKLLTLKKNYEHHFIHLNKRHYEQHFDELIETSSGMHVFDHGLFHGIGKDIAKHVDVTFNGHGFDYMFQGMYIPKDNFKIFGKPTYLNKLRTLKKEFITDYFENISYKYKHINPLKYINAKSKIDVIDSINKELKKVFEEGKNYGCESFYDSWDYMITHNISSHYPYTNVVSMHNTSQPRTVSFDNDIFDIFLKIPIEYRLNGKILKETLKYLDKDFANIISANNGLKITSSPLSMTLKTIFRKILSKISDSKKFKHPSASERTWPDRYDYLMNNKYLYSKAEDLISSEYIDIAMPYLDRDLLNKDIKNWLNGDRKGGDFLFRLITINEFLKKGYA